MGVLDDASVESSASSGPEIDPEDPMAAFLLEQKRERKAEKKAKKTKHKSRHVNETSEERRARKEMKKEKKRRKLAGQSAGLRGVEELLKNLGADRSRGRDAMNPSPSAKPRHSRSPNSSRHDYDDGFRSRSDGRSSHSYRRSHSRDGEDDSKRGNSHDGFRREPLGNTSGR